MKEAYRRNHPHSHNLIGMVSVLARLLADNTVVSTTNRNKQLWDTCYRGHTRYLARLGQKLKIPQDLTEEAVQDVWVKILAHWAEFQQPDGAKRLLALSRKMMHDTLVDRIRRRDQEKWTSLDGLTAESREQTLSISSDVMKTQEQREWIEAGLNHLPEKDAWLLHEHYLMERSIKALAREKGLTEHALHCQMSRALKALRRILSDR